MLRLFLLFLSATLTHGQISFGPSQEISDAISTGIGFAKAADMDGDGDLDVVAAEQYGVRVLWWENDGNGQFGTQREWVWGSATMSVISLEDWNGDDLPDVWIEHAVYDPSTELITRTFYVAVNSGSGIFPNPLTIGSFNEDPSFPETVVIDLNGDSRMDILTGHAVYLSGEDGFLLSGSDSLPIFEGNNVWDRPDDLVGYDFDHDGDTDFLALSDFWTSGSLLLIENLDDGGFNTPTTLLSPSADPLVRSGLLQVVAGTSFGTLYLTEENLENGAASIRSLRLDTSGTLSAEATLPLPSLEDLPPLSWSDFRLLESSRILASAIQTDGGATHFYEINLTTQSVTRIHSFAGVSECRLATLADLNADTHPDLFLPLSTLPGVNGSTPNRIEWLPAGASGNFTLPPESINEGLSNPEILATGDFDGNGSPEFMVGSCALINFTNLGFDQLSRWSSPDDGESWITSRIPLDRDLFTFVAPIDIEGNFLIFPEQGAEFWIHCSAGRGDFLIQTFQRTRGTLGTFRFEWFLQDDAGGFHLYPLTSESSKNLASASLIDWDGDDIEDLVYETVASFGQGTGVKWRKGSGSGFGPPTSVTNQSGIGSDAFGSPLLVSPPLVDFDWDGDPDLLLNGNLFGSYSSYWLENDGSGSLVSAHLLDQTISLARADLDRDGHADYLSSSSSNPYSTEILLARPESTFLSAGLLSSPPSELHFLDLDDDDDLDVITSHPREGLADYRQLVWWENYGHSISSSIRTFGDSRWGSHHSISTADLDGNGVDDLIVASSVHPRIECFKITHTPEPAPFTTAMETLGLTGHSAGPFSDWDLDGMLNWDEFAFGSNPAVPDPNHPGRPHLEQSPSGTTYTFQRRTDAASLCLSYDTEHSINLREWEPWTPSPTVDSPSGNYERVSLPAPITQDKEFFRTTVSDPPAPQ